MRHSTSHICTSRHNNGCGREIEHGKAYKKNIFPFSSEVKLVARTIDKLKEFYIHQLIFF